MDDPPPQAMYAVALLPKTAAYKNQGKTFLENEFPIISCAAIKVLLEHVDFHVPEAFQLLTRIQYSCNDIADRLHGQDAKTKAMIKERVQQVFPQMPKMKVFLKNNRPTKRLRVTEAGLLRDLQGFLLLDDDDDDNGDHGNNGKENEPPMSVNNATGNNSNAQKAVGIEESTTETIECGCCYGDYPPKDMKECDANQGHRVCKDCIYRYVSEQLDGNNNTAFRCIIDEKCPSSYHRITVLEEVLSPGLKRRADEAIYKDQITQAGVEGLWTCQICNNMGFLDAPSATVFCEPCNKEYCTTCHRPQHSERTCEQMQADEDRAKDPLHMAHERMSEAVTRRCPQCQTAFVKHDGCNKMTCVVTGCKTKSCYLCGVQVEDYSHFCDHRRKNMNTPCRFCKRCDLFTSTESMDLLDRNARYNAGFCCLDELGWDADRINKSLKSPRKESPSPAVAHEVVGAGQVLVVDPVARAPRPQERLPVAPPGVNQGNMMQQFHQMVFRLGQNLDIIVAFAALCCYFWFRFVQDRDVYRPP